VRHLAGIAGKRHRVRRSPGDVRRVDEELADDVRIVDDTSGHGFRRVCADARAHAAIISSQVSSALTALPDEATDDDTMIL